MNQNSEIKEPEIMEPEDGIEIDADNSPSVDDFLAELEAKEKDLHITADFGIEIEDADFEGPSGFEIVPVEKPEPTVTGNAGTPIRPIADSQTLPPGMKTRVFELEKEVELLKKNLTALRIERNDVQEKSDRRRKDFESYKYRMDRERRGAFISQIANVATQLLPVLDNLDRALESIKDVPDNKRSEFKQFFDGVALVNQQINDVFAGMGVQPIATAGETFDPNFHEAVITEDDPDLPPNTVSGEMLRGYRIGNLVIRHSMVKVTLGAGPASNGSKEVIEGSNGEVAEIEPYEPVHTTAENNLPDEPPTDA
jgi:molecular chaperone GrpE